MSITNACEMLSGSPVCRFSTMAMMMSRRGGCSFAAAIVCADAGLHRLPTSSLPLYLASLVFYLLTSPAWLISQYVTLALCASVIYVVFPMYAVKYKRPRAGRRDIAHIENTSRM